MIIAQSVDMLSRMPRGTRDKPILHRQVRSLIDGQRQLRPDRKVLAPGGSSADLHTDQIGAGQIPHYSMLAPGEPPAQAMPRTSEGAVSVEAKLGKSYEVQTPAGHTTGLSHVALPEVTAVSHVTIIAHSAATKKGESVCPDESDIVPVPFSKDTSCSVVCMSLRF